MSKTKPFWKTARSSSCHEDENEISGYYHSTRVFHYNKITNIVFTRGGI